MVMVDEIFVPERQSENALPDEGTYTVLDQLRAAAIAKAGGETLNQADHPIGGTQKHRTGVGGNGTADEIDRQVMDQQQRRAAKRDE